MLGLDLRRCCGPSPPRSDPIRALVTQSAPNRDTAKRLQTLAQTS